MLTKEKKPINAMGASLRLWHSMLLSTLVNNALLAAREVLFKKGAMSENDQQEAKTEYRQISELFGMIEIMQKTVFGQTKGRVLFMDANMKTFSFDSKGMKELSINEISNILIEKSQKERSNHE